MNNSEKMVASLQKQDLAHANKYFERALTNDTEEELLELADYLESIGFFPQAKRIYENLAPHYPESYISLAQIASEDGKVEEAFAYLEEIKFDSDWYVTALLDLELYGRLVLLCHRYSCRQSIISPPYNQILGTYYIIRWQSSSYRLYP